MFHTAKAIKATLAQANLKAKNICDDYGTPVYVYSAEVIRQQYQRLTTALENKNLGGKCHIHYAIKANDRVGILNVIKQLGAGVDLVSMGEHIRANKAGFHPKDQVYSGVGKTAEDLRSAVCANIGQINVESLAELHILERVCQKEQKKTRVAFRLNPDTKAGGHQNISTGSAEHKFGMAEDDTIKAIRFAEQSEFITPIGIALHIGSQINDGKPYRQAFAKLNAFLARTNFTPEVLDLGGGFAVDYEEGTDIFALDDYASALAEAFGHTPYRLMVEPGRFLVAQSGILLFTALLEKQASHLRWVITDMGMNDMMRPALYQAKHRLSVLDELSGDARPVTIGGPVCESTDKLGEYFLPPCPEGTILALHDVGAYGSVMANSYNARNLPAEVLVDHDRVTLLRRAITTEDFLKFE